MRILLENQSLYILNRDGRRELLDRRVMHNAYQDLDKRVLYVKSGPDPESGDLILFENGKKKVLEKNIKLVAVSEQFEIIVFLASHKNKIGTLTVLKNLKERVSLRYKVYFADVLVDLNPTSFKINFSVEHKNYESDFYCYKNGEVSKIAERIRFARSSIRYVKTKKDTLGLLYLKGNSVYKYEDGETVLLTDGVEHDFSTNYQGNQLLYTKLAEGGINRKYDVFITSVNESKHMCVGQYFSREQKDDIFRFGFSINGVFGNYFNFNRIEEMTDIQFTQEIKQEYYDMFIPDSVKLPERTLFLSNLTKNQNYYVAKKLIQDTSGFKQEEIQFNLPYDDGENIAITLPDDEAYFEFLQLTDSELNIYGYTIQELINGVDTVRGYNPIAYPSRDRSGLTFKDLEYVTSLHETCKEIQDSLHLGSQYDFINYFFEKHLAAILELKHKKNHFFNHYLLGKDRSSIENFKLKRAKIIEELILEGIMPAKWRSEAELFKTVKKEFDDAQLHVTLPWLSPQHFDVYIPSLNIALEYQGIQHFKPVSYFGGEEGFQNTVKRDQRKKEKCKQNGVHLIEWMYDEPINKKNLLNKIKEFR
ncbi:hypothetical protein V7654_20255 [Bacillus sp. JJ1609]|uniref:hypothetical protein n=1 Tax=Bacillus sp. JJ1609 TaxID=3122977 RepID=UPI003000C77E